MPQPTLGSVHVNAPLTNVSVAYLQAQTNFVATKIFPVVPVDKQSDVYYTYTKNDWFRDEAQLRAPGDESAGSGYNISNTAYNAKVWSFHKDIPDQIRANSDPMLNPDRDATMFVTEKLLLRLERQWATDFFTTGIWGTDKTPTFLWDDYPNSDPIGDIRAGVSQIQGITGKKPNKLAIGYQAFIKLVDHPDIVERIKYGGTPGAPAAVNEQTLAQLFGLDEVLVCNAIYATNNEGATDAYSYIFGKNALLCYSAPAPGLMTASAGYVFAWTGVSQGLGQTVGVSKFRMEWKKQDRVEGEIAFANQTIATDLGYFFSSVVS